MKRITLSMLAVAAAMLASGQPAMAASCNGNGHQIVLSNGSATPGAGTTSTVDPVLGPIRRYGRLRTVPRGGRGPGRRDVSAQWLRIGLRGRRDLLAYAESPGRQPCLLVQGDERQEGRRPVERLAIEGDDHRPDTTPDATSNATPNATPRAAAAAAIDPQASRTSTTGPAAANANRGTHCPPDRIANGRCRELASRPLADRAGCRRAVTHRNRRMVAGDAGPRPPRAAGQ